MDVALPNWGTGEDEFPSLTNAGLYAMNTLGNGNCLFNALSDQLYGNQSMHGELRSNTIDYMRVHGDYYKQFIEVHPGGGTRRNPKRKNAGGFSTRFSHVSATAEEIDRTFESHLRQMARGGTYGDNMEIAAFSAAYNVDVKIYRRDFAYVVSDKAGGRNADGPANTVVHIAHHTWEHYSSVRNVEGPHTGLPEVKSVTEDRTPEVCLPKTGLDGATDRSWNLDAVRKKIFEGSGTVGDVISLRGHEKSTTPSTQGSSSVELDLDSDDEEPVRGPNKRQNRRLSRASMMAKDKEDRSRDLTFRPKNGHLATTGEPSTSTKTSRGVTSVVIDDSEEEDWRKDGSRIGSEATSFSTASSEQSVAGKATSAGVRLKLSQPKKDSAPVKKPADIDADWPVVGAKAKTSTYKGTARTCPPGSPSHRRLIQERKRSYRSVVVPESKVINAGPGTKPLMTTQGNERTPMIENRMKVVYI